MKMNYLLFVHLVPNQRVFVDVFRASLFALSSIISVATVNAQDGSNAVGNPKVQQERETDLKAAQDALSKKWVVDITPYVWATGISGSLQPFAGRRTIKFDESFTDVLEDLNSAFFLAGYARKGRLVVAGDFSFVDLSDEGVVPPNVKARGSLRQASLTFAVGYQAVAKQRMILDVLVGFRSWLLKPGVEAEAGGIDKSSEKSFTDIVLATRRNFRISDDWSFLLYGDVGIFRVGSHATSQVVGTFSYRASRDFFLSMGYRELSVDYRKNGSRVDARLSGPIFGATWRF